MVLFSLPAGVRAMVFVAMHATFVRTCWPIKRKCPLQGIQLVHCDTKPVPLMSTVFGVCLWAAGLSVNVISDCALQTLRRRWPQKGMLFPAVLLPSVMHPQSVTL